MTVIPTTVPTVRHICRSGSRPLLRATQSGRCTYTLPWQTWQDYIRTKVS